MENTTTIGEALMWKYPDQIRECVSKQKVGQEPEIVQWEADMEQPSESEIQTIMNEHIAWKDAQDQAKADLKASAKAKLIAGEPLTEEEADTIVL